MLSIRRLLLAAVALALVAFAIADEICIIKLRAAHEAPDEAFVTGYFDFDFEPSKQYRMVTLPLVSLQPLTRTPRPGELIRVRVPDDSHLWKCVDKEVIGHSLVSRVIYTGSRPVTTVGFRVLLMKGNRVVDSRDVYLYKHWRKDPNFIIVD